LPGGASRGRERSSRSGAFPVARWRNRRLVGRQRRGEVVEEVRPAEPVVHEVQVRVLRELRRRVPEPVLDLLEVLAVREQQARAGVAQPVERQPVQARGLAAGRRTLCSAQWYSIRSPVAGWANTGSSPLRPLWSVQSRCATDRDSGSSRRPAAVFGAFVMPLRVCRRTLTRGRSPNSMSAHCSSRASPIRRPGVDHELEEQPPLPRRAEQRAMSASPSARRCTRGSRSAPSTRGTRGRSRTGCGAAGRPRRPWRTSRGSR
jgi:hypothetical protein